MINIHKKIIAVITILTLVFGSNIMPYAASVPSETINTVSPRSNHYEGAGVDVDNKTWKTIATSTTGFGCNVQVNTFNTEVNYVSVKMLGKTGNVVWSETNAIPYNKSRVFECGSDVYEIKVKCVGSDNRSTVSCWPTTREPGIYSN